jgi:hypothetical protein
MGASWSSAPNEFVAQFTEPSDIFSVLLILGGDVVQLALAALAGGSPFTPVAFSFGWVAYAISAVLSAFGDNCLVRCAPEIGLKVFNMNSGYRRDNQSWLLARFFKTYPFWMSPEARSILRYGSQTPPPRDEEHSKSPQPYEGAFGDPPAVALCVAVYDWVEQPRGTPGIPTRDLLWWSGLLTTIVQLGIAAIPFGLHHDWSIFFATAAGSLLSHISASLPQWRREKWHARRYKNDVALTIGNGSQHVVVILGADHGLNLEDLAGSRAPDLLSTRISTMALAVCWLVLLIACTGIKQNTWFLLAVGGLGMMHNLVVAGAPRLPSAMGLPIELHKNNMGEGEIFSEPKVMWALMELEEKHEGFGKALIDEFFPGTLRKWEQKWWEPSTSLTERRQLLKQAKKEEISKELKKKAGS